MRIFVSGVCDRTLSDGEAAVLMAWLGEFGADGRGAEEAAFHVGPLTCLEHGRFQSGLLAMLPPGVSATIETDWQECDEPGKDISYVGPRAGELEIAAIDVELRRLLDRREVLVAARTHALYGRRFRVLASFPDTEVGTIAANGYMEANPHAAVLTVDAGQIILAGVADMGQRS